jgi:hypothetical protein
MSAEVTILKVDMRFPDEVVAANQVPVNNLNFQQGILRKCGLNLKAPATNNSL